MRANLTKLRWAYLPECEAVPSGWSAVPFTSIADVNAGQSPPSKSYNHIYEGTPFLQGSGDFSNKHPYPTVWCNSPKKIAEKGDVLISIRAPVGEVNLADRAYAIGRGLAAIQAKNCDVSFLYHALHRWRLPLQRIGQGTTFDAITARHFSQLLVSIPNEEREQTAIARILDAVDTTIECTRETIERVKVLRNTVLEELFCDLGAEPRYFADFITDVRYGTSEVSNNRKQGNPVLRIPNVVGNKLLLNDLAFVELSPANIERLRLTDGDILLVRTNGNPNYVGRSVVFRKPDNREWIYASYLIRVRVKEELLPDFVNTYLGLERGRRELLRRVTTSAGNHNINTNSIRLIQLPVPSSIDDQYRISELAKKFQRYRDDLTVIANALQTLKTNLMHDLLTGKVRVRDLSEASLS